MPLRDAMVGSTRTPLLVLLASAALVLLIACANLAGALLSRGLSRRKEFAVRVALGAGRGRLVRQLLTESTVLALAGGAAGLLLAQSLLSAACAASPGRAAGLRRSVARSRARCSSRRCWRCAPAWPSAWCRRSPSAAPDAQGTLRDETRGASEGRRPRRLRGVLVAGQMALCASLLAGAGLLARSLWEMTRAPLGFDPDGVLTASVPALHGDYPTLQARARFREQLAERLRLLPGVDAVAIAHKIPTVDLRTASFTHRRGAAGRRAALRRCTPSVSDDYFRTLRIPLRRGRTFDASDRADAPPTVVISESMARRYWPAGDALGVPRSPRAGRNSRDGRRHRRRRAQRSRPAGCRADGVQIPPAGIDAAGSASCSARTAIRWPS